jgi:hypothetical protein
MTIDSPSVLLVQNDVEPGRESDFDAWYLADHMPDRVSVSGFRRARRWRAFEGGPRDLSLYEIDGSHVMSSGAYLARLAEPTPGTRRNMDAFIGMRRSVCEVHGAAGFADGGCAVLVPAAPPAGDAWLARLLATSAWRADSNTGVVARALLRCDGEASRSNSVESRLRGSEDQTIDVAAWVEATTPAQARMAAAATGDALRAAGLVAGAPVLLHLIAAFQRPGG